MGIFSSKFIDPFEIKENSDRVVFIRNVKQVSVYSLFCPGRFALSLDVSYLKYKWNVQKRFKDILRFEKHMRDFYRDARSILPIPRSCSSTLTHDQQNRVAHYFLQSICDNLTLFNTPQARFFFDLSTKFPLPELGMQGKQGYMLKTSGGYAKGFSRKFGDFIIISGRRFVVMKDTYIAWYLFPGDSEKPRGVFLIDSGFNFSRAGRSIHIKNSTRHMRLILNRTRTAIEWVEFMEKLYCVTNIPRMLLFHPRASSFPVRDSIDVKVYTYSKHYMAAVAVALLQAQKEIFITSWKNSPRVLLTRHPLPSLRLDQILKYKADLGVKIFILLYKEVELAGQGNDSGKAAKYLEDLSPNIQCMRHPNKFIGGSTAVLWSHHEKLVVVDRNIAFVGGIDLAFNRWDDEKHNVADEDGLRYPGRDYRQPGVGKFPRPARNVGNEVELAFRFTTGTLTESGVETSTDLFSDDLAELENDDLGSEETPSSLQISSAGGDSKQEASPRWTNDNSGLRNSFTRLKSRVQEAVSSRVAQLMPAVNEIVDASGKAMSNIAESVKSKVHEKFNGGTVQEKLEVRDLYPRMGWHDIHCGVSGAAARDVGTHFIKRWNHHLVAAGYKMMIPLCDVTDNICFGICAKCQMENILETAELCPTCGNSLGPVSYMVAAVQPQFLPPLPDTLKHIVFRCEFGDILGLNFCGDNPTIVSTTRYDLEKLVLRSSVISVHGNSCEAPATVMPQVGDIVLTINDLQVGQLDHTQIERIILRIKRENMDSKMPIVLTFRRHFQVKELPLQQLQLKAGKDENLLSMSQLLYDSSNRSKIEVMSRNSLSGTCKVQVLRSLGPWSGGIDREYSIMNAYNEAIVSAEKFIYIENQFFIGDLAGKDVQNSIAKCLLDRIVTAALENTDFRVIILMPQHPNGDIANSSKPRIILHFELATICRGATSLIEQFKSKVPQSDWRKYIGFYCLRSNGFINGHFFSDQIYVHDKLMIVDDRVAIIGSANINDRSMLGDRDSEVAVRIEDTVELTVMVNGSKFQVRKFAYELRQRLMRQHVGDGDGGVDFTDMVGEASFRKNWQDFADSNTVAYDNIDRIASVYKCKTLESYQNGLKRNPHLMASDLLLADHLPSIKGFLVNWPYDFLREEDLAPTPATRMIIPNDLWV